MADDGTLRIEVSGDVLIGLGVATRTGNTLTFTTPPLGQDPLRLILGGWIVGSYTIGGISAQYVSAADHVHYVLTLHRVRD